MSEQSNKESVRYYGDGSPVEGALLHERQQVMDEQSQSQRCHQPRPFYPYNIHHSYPAPPITGINQLPWKPMTSYGGVWCLSGLSGLSVVRRPTPLYMAHRPWTSLAQGALSPLHPSENQKGFCITDRSIKKSSVHETQGIMKSSVIQHTSDADNTITRTSPISQTEEEQHEKPHHSKEHCEQLSLQAIPEKKERASTSNNELPNLANIKEEKMDSPVDGSPCSSTTTPTCNVDHPITALKEEARFEEKPNKTGGVTALSASFLYDTDNAFQEPASVFQTPYGQDRKSVLQGLSTYSLQYNAERESAFQIPPKFSQYYNTDNKSAFQTLSYSSQFNADKESAFQKPLASTYSSQSNAYRESEFQTLSKHPTQLNADKESAFQKPSTSSYSSQFDADRESAFDKIKAHSTSCHQPLLATSTHHEPQEGPSGLSYSAIGSGNTAAPTTKNKPRSSKHVCDECGRSFTRSSTLVTHKRIHTGEKPFECEICGRAFRQPGNLSRHRLTHTTSKPYVCPHCNKAFNRASNLHTHMRTHSDYKPYKCEFCDKRFHQKVDMKIHRYTHTGEKPHRCPKCGRGFKQLTHLTYHLRTHSEVRMYQCEFCGKGFNQKGNLQAHRYRHTGERPFKCDVCGKGFTLASTRNTHLRTHATKKPFECQYCEKSFYQKNALKTHYIASHPYTDGVLIL